MRVTIPLSVTIDPELWAREYGIEPGQWNEHVRNDVKRYVETTIGEALRMTDDNATATVR